VSAEDGAPNRTDGEPRAPLSDALMAVVALIGLLDAVYLTVEHLSGRSVRCVVVSGCDEVLSSSYATLPGDIPLAALGSLAYFTAFSLSTLAAFGYAKARVLLTPLVAAMFAGTLWLLYVQAVVLRAFCTYCLISAAVTTTLVLLLLGQRLSVARRRYS
jgi:uncharacterized membrane protein